MTASVKALFTSTATSSLLNSSSLVMGLQRTVMRSLNNSQAATGRILCGFGFQNAGDMSDATDVIVLILDTVSGIDHAIYAAFPSKDFTSPLTRDT